MATNGRLAMNGFATDGSNSVRYVEVNVRDGGIGAFMVGAIAGERNQSSLTNSYMVTKQECNVTRVAATGTQIITTSPAHVFGFVSNATTGGNVSFFDATASGTTATALFVQPTNINFVSPAAMRFESGVSIANTVSGVLNDISVLWRPIG